MRSSIVVAVAAAVAVVVVADDDIVVAAAVVEIDWYSLFRMPIRTNLSPGSAHCSNYWLDGDASHYSC